MVTPLHPITASRASRSEQPAASSVDFIRSGGSAPEREHVRQSCDCAGARKGSIIYKKARPGTTPMSISAFRTSPSIFAGCPRPPGVFSSAWKKHREHQRGIDETEETYLVLVREPDVLRDGRLILGLRLHLSDLLEVQLRELQLLLALRNLGIQVNEALHAVKVNPQTRSARHPRHSLGREGARQPSA